MKETRKIQITGGSTYIVSLPSDWVKERGLSKGSEVFLSSAGSYLQIYPLEEKSHEITKELEITKGANLSEIQRALTSFYISNFDTCIIRSNEYIDQDLRDSMNRFSRMVMGVEVVEETSNTIVLQNVLKSNTFPLENAIRRMILMVETMIEDTNKAIKAGDMDLLKNVVHRDDEVDRYQWYIYRESRFATQESQDNVFFLIFSRILERIADHAVNVCKVLIDSKQISGARNKGINELLVFAYDMFRDSVHQFFLKDFGAMNQLIERKNEIENRRDDILKISSGKDAGNMSLLVEEISRIGFYSTDIAELAMDRVAAKSDSISL